MARYFGTGPLSYAGQVNTTPAQHPSDTNVVDRVASATMNWFPVRVWRRVLAYNGLLLSSGVSYQALFATFAALYVGVAVFGVWFVTDTVRLDSMIEIVNTYIPGLIGENGAVTRDQLFDIADRNLGHFGWGGVIATALLLWTSSSWITYSRMAIRTVFGLPKDQRSYVLLKGRDLVTAILLGAVLIIGTALATASTNMFDWFTGLFGVTGWSLLSAMLIRIAGLLIVFILNAAVLSVMFFTLSGVQLRFRQVLTGVTLGGLALTVLQVLGSYVLGFGSSNPLLATFVVFVTLLFWFRLTAIVTLTAAAWTAESLVRGGNEVQSKPAKPSRWTTALR